MKAREPEWDQGDFDKIPALSEDLERALWVWMRMGIGMGMGIMRSNWPMGRLRGRLGI